MIITLDVYVTDEQYKWMSFYVFGEELQLTNPPTVSDQVSVKRFIRVGVEERLQQAKEHYQKHHPELTDEEVAAIEAAARKEDA